VTGRKVEVVKAPEWCGARDAGKVFLITEWPAARAEKWALRAFLAYNRGGGELPLDQVAGLGMRGIFALGVQTFLRGQIQATEVIPILDELLDCVQMIRDPTKRGPDGKVIATPIVSDDDVAEVRTRMWLRSEVLRVHVNFSIAGALSNLLQLLMTEAAPASQIT